MSAAESRVLVVAPVGHDAEAMATMLRREGVMAEVYAGAAECVEALEAGAGAVLLTEEALELPAAADLLESFKRQPAWSELPLIILTSGGEARSARLLELVTEAVGAVTLLERPMGAGTLLHSVKVALRSRRRQYEVRDLLAERERFRALVTATSEAVYRMSADWKQMLHLQGKGFIPDTLAASSTWLDTYIDPTDRPQVTSVINEAIRSGSVFESEHRVLRTDGTLGWTFSRAIPLRNSHGKIVEWFGTARDITERKRAEAHLQADVAALTQMHELSRRVLDAGGLQRMLQEVMDGAVAILRAQRGTLQLFEGESLRIVAHHGHERPFLEFFEAAENRASVCGEASRRGERVVVPDIEQSPLFTGTPSLSVLRQAGVRAVQSTPLMSRSGTLLGVLTTQWEKPYAPDEHDLWRLDLLARQAADLIEDERAQEALRQANQRLSYHVQNTPLAVIEFDAELRVCGWNDGAQRIFGWEAAEVMGRPLWEIPWICEEDRGKVEQVSAGLASGQSPRMVSPNRNVRKDGKVIWCEWYSSSLTDASGKMQSIQSLVLDVTERKEAEAVLARDKEQLERLVAERTAKLQELVGELEHFSYSITHDMRAPLRAMMAFAQVAEELSGDCPNPEQRTFLARIQTAAKRMDLLITDALSYGRAIRNELPLAPVDPGRLLRGMVDTYPELQAAQGAIRIEPALPLVMGNEAGLTQCFSNLLGNAVKFVKPGQPPEIRVWAEVLPEHHQREQGIQPSRSPANRPDGEPNLRRQGEGGVAGRGWVRIWVEDHGIGIGPRMLPRVFDMFARGASEQAGTGIGLALVRKVAERMGGRVGVVSEEGKGSRFWVDLRPGDVKPKDR